MKGGRREKGWGGHDTGHGLGISKPARQPSAALAMASSHMHRLLMEGYKVKPAVLRPQVKDDRAQTCTGAVLNDGMTFQKVSKPSR